MGQRNLGTMQLLAVPECDPIVQLVDWRRRNAELYAAVRNAATPYAGWTLWRAVREDLFREHPQSPLGEGRIANKGGIPHFDYDPTWRLIASTRSLGSYRPHTVELPEGALRMRPALRTCGLESRLGRELMLYWIEGYGGGLFLPFRDATAGGETYGGGRYVIDTIKGADLGMAPDGRLILDFNFAYHPSCAHLESWVCPLAPRENWLAVPVRAGERL